MDTAIKSLIAALAGLVALSGLAAAQGCPECDEDGPANAENSYYDVDVGVVDEDERHGAVGDTDVAYDDKSSDGGFFLWLSICLHTWIDKVETLLGMESNVDGNVEVYASEDGADVDATMRAVGEVVDFDDSPVGHLDGATWDAMSDVGATVRDVDRPELPHPQDRSVEVCVVTDASLGACA